MPWSFFFGALGPPSPLGKGIFLGRRKGFLKTTFGGQVGSSSPGRGANISHQKAPLVGGFSPTPLTKHDSKWVHLSQVSGWNQKKTTTPPPLPPFQKKVSTPWKLQKKSDLPQAWRAWSDLNKPKIHRVFRLFFWLMMGMCCLFFWKWNWKVSWVGGF